MAVAIDTRKIEDWFTKTQGYKVIQSTDDAAPVEDLPEVSLDEAIALAQNSDWIKFEDMADTPYAQSGFMYPDALEIGQGNPIDAYRDRAGSKVTYLCAYRV